MRRTAGIVAAVIALSAYSAPAGATRIKDISRVGDFAGTQLIGYGLVTGLQGSGDSRNTFFTIQSVTNMLQRLGINVSSEDIQQRMRVRNVAAVMVTAELPPFSGRGSRIDVTVSSLGDAKSLAGGVLLATPLTTTEGTIRADAQGAVTVGGYHVVGGTGESLRKNYTSVGRVPAGAIVRDDSRVELAADGRLVLELAYPDYTTASRIAEGIDAAFGGDLASARDAASVLVLVPEESRTEGRLVTFISRLESIEIDPDTRAKVVINERSGTVVVGSDVVIRTVAVSHGNLRIEIQSSPVISQPAPFSQGRTVVTTDEEMAAAEGQQQFVLLEEGTNVKDLVEALNALGASPADIVSIFEAIREAGALGAELIVM